eukprot:GHRR01012179.1.p1 GENE.GHRR01012179.1~~GHRR01012179.1.p1  ORF type:complete len:112 (-),score=21.75 GHRR01012179.1:293-628(-)
MQNHCSSMRCHLKYECHPVHRLHLTIALSARCCCLAATSLGVAASSAASAVVTALQLCLGAALLAAAAAVATGSLLWWLPDKTNSDLLHCHTRACTTRNCQHTAYGSLCFS